MHLLNPVHGSTRGLSRTEYLEYAKIPNLEILESHKISKFQEISGNQFDYQANFVFRMNFKY